MIRVFRLTLNGVNVTGAVQKLLGLPNHHRQAQVLVAAPSKAAAWGYASAMPNIGCPSRSDPDFRIAMGNCVDALVAAGQLDRLRALAFGDRGGPVVEVRADGAHHVIGWLSRSGHVGWVFEPAAGA